MLFSDVISETFSPAAVGMVHENVSRETFSCKMSGSDSWLAKMRQELEMTQEQFAKEVGVTPRTILNWENGHHEPKLTIRQVKKICQLLKLSIEEMPDTFVSQNNNGV